MRLSARQRQILGLLGHGSYVEVKDLAQSLGVDGSTIRRDLQGLTANGLVDRLHGGAILRSSAETTPSLGQPNEGEHQAIAQAARRMLKDGDSLCISSGPITSLLILSMLDMHDMTVVTNDLRSAMTLSQNPSFKVHLAGGELRESPSHVTSGARAETFAAEHITRWSFIEVEGIHPYSGFTISATWQAGIQRALLAAGRRRCIIADSHSFGKRCIGFVADTSNADLIMTDELLDDYDLPAFGGKVIRVALDPGDSWRQR
ncbi:MAG: DeoR/GlpR family DNA-binding transcription regulator [Actinomycetaceae bacterium]|nr:DeoR/GlpR family DNA-binding transcription regulator [Actinomycetaceae bacterium]